LSKQNIKIAKISYLTPSRFFDLTPTPLPRERGLLIDYQLSTPLLPWEKGSGDEVDSPGGGILGEINSQG
jgi:hypothetical protein